MYFLNKKKRQKENDMKSALKRYLQILIEWYANFD